MKKNLMLLTTFFVLMVAALSVLLNYQIQFVIAAISEQDITSFYLQMMYIVGITLLLLVFEYARQVCNVRYLNQVGSYFHGKSLSSALSRLISVNQEEQVSVGETVSEINNDIEMIKELHYDTQISMVQGIMSFLFSTIALYLINVWVATAIMITMFLPICLPLFFKQSLKRKQENISAKKKTYITFLSDILTNKLSIKNSRHYKNVVNVTNEHYEQMNVATLAKQQQVALVNVLVGLGFYLPIMIILFVGGHQVLLGNLQIGALVSVFSITQELTLPANLIANSIGNLQSVSAIHENLMEQERDDIEDEQFEELHSILLKDISIRLNHQQFTQKNSILFEKGKKYLITGESGRGKSLLMLVLTGNFREYSGEVLLNNQDSRKLNYQMIQQQIAYIPQSESLLHDSILNNLLYYGSEYSSEEIMQWIHRFYLEHRFPTFESLQEVYTENSSLSGGQIQRLMLIRTLLEHKEWLILDESLSALDKELYTQIERELLCQPQLTVIHITHRVESEYNTMYDKVIRL